MCLLTAEVARTRRVPIDRLLMDGTFEPAEAGYVIRLPPTEQHWALANQFAEEEAACCAALALSIAEEDSAIVLTAAF